MKIAVDAMGGDYAPSTIVQGAVEAAKEFGAQIILVGDKEIVGQELANYNVDGLSIFIKHASEVVEMDESPMTALRRKKDSSIGVAINLVKSGEARAVVSAGNTGAVMTTAKVFLRTLKGVDRPAIATLLPTSSGISILLDVGANVDCKPNQLLQFAIMGEVYAKYILNAPNPRVGLLSIGEEDLKGNEITKETFKLLKSSSINFTGNIEGKEVYQGKADVIVCDGFIGNVALKISESVAEMIENILREEFSRSWRSKLGFLLMKSSFREFKKRVDSSEYGGAPLLGINGICIIAHGSSSPKAIKNAIRVALEFIKYKINTHIMEGVEGSEDISEYSYKKTARVWRQIKEKTKEFIGEKKTEISEMDESEDN